MVHNEPDEVLINVVKSLLKVKLKDDITIAVMCIVEDLISNHPTIFNGPSTNEG